MSKQRAAGGIVWRRAKAGPEFLLVHRDRYDDWTFPKGKLEKGETEQQAAEREVAEETGFVSLTGAAMDLISYPFGAVDKTVRFFLMEAIGGAFTANEEVDRIEWASKAAALKKLSYEASRALLADLDVEALTEITRIVVVRHGNAGRRDNDDPNDRDRQLDERGRRQAKELAARFTGLRPGRIISSAFPRCVQTVEPLAESLGLPIETDEALAEPVDRKDIRMLFDEVLGHDVVLCTHGDAFPHLLDHVGSYAVDFRSPLEWKKSSVWVVECRDGMPTFADYLPPPS